MGRVQPLTFMHTWTILPLEIDRHTLPKGYPVNIVPDTLTSHAAPMTAHHVAKLRRAAKFDRDARYRTAKHNSRKGGR